MIAVWMIAGGLAVAGAALLLRRRAVRVRAARALTQVVTRVSPFPMSD
jgi:hypothetical protein